MDGKRIVLFVDDQAALAAFRRVLIDEPYELLLAGGDQEALQVMSQHEVAVIVSDMMMPGMDGIKLLNTVKEKYPSAIRMLISDNANITGLLEAINKNIIYKFITKPFNDDELKSIVRQGIEYYNLRRERDLLLAQVGQYRQQNPETKN